MRLDGTGFEPLTKEPGTHMARMSPDGRHFLGLVQHHRHPPTLTLYRADGTLVRKVGDALDAAEAATYAWGKAELFTIPSGDGYDLPA